MLNEPPPGERRRHPLDRPPARPPEDPQRPRQQLTLHLPRVEPLVTYGLLALNIGVFILRALSPRLNENLLLNGANNPIAVLVDGEYHRLLASMFLHSSIITPDGEYMLQNSLHLIFNMYILYSVGTTLEALFGHWRFGLVYLLGGLAGSVLSTVFNPPQTFAVGASGAVFAILGAEFIYLYRHRKLLGEMGRAQMRHLFTLIVINLMFGLVTEFGGGVRIDNWAHLGGLIGGVVLTWNIGPLLNLQKHPDIPNHVIGVDINPLRRKWWAVSLYISALLLILLVASILARGG
jgi:rhomboid protease GluP